MDKQISYRTLLGVYYHNVMSLSLTTTHPKPKRQPSHCVLRPSLVPRPSDLYSSQVVMDDPVPCYSYVRESS